MMKRNFTETRRSTKFIDKILEFIETLETDTISIHSVFDGVSHNYIVKNPQYEILHEENVLGLFDEQQKNSLQIPIDEIMGVSNTVYTDSVTCSICFVNNGLNGVSISALG